MEMLSCVSNEEVMEGVLKMERQSYLSNRYRKLIAIDNTDSAVKISRQGFWAAFIIAVFMLLLFFLRIAEQPFDAMASGLLWRSIVFGGTAWGIFKVSRIAAFLGFAFHFFFHLYPSFTLWLKSILDFNSAIVIIILAFMFINGIRGTFAYHKYKGNTP
jgi:hypothetical protein